MEKVHLHFALSEFDQARDYFIQGHGKKQKLQTYASDPTALARHKKGNTLLAAVPDSHKHKLTHFLEDVEISTSKISRISVVSPAVKADDILPDLISVHFHIPTKSRKKAIKKSGGKLAHPLVSKYLGVTKNLTAAATPAEASAVATAYDVVLPPLAVAQTIVFHHPEIGTVDTDTAAQIYSNYMQNENNFDQLVNYVSNNPGTSNNPWYKKTYSIKVDPVTLQQSPMTPTSSTFADGKPVAWPTDPVSGQKVIPQYELSDETTGSTDGGVTGAAKSAVYGVLKQTKNDPAFNGALWTRSQSNVSQKQSNVSPTVSVQSNGKLATNGVAELRESDSYWTAKYDSDRQYGLDLYGNDIKFEDNKVSLPVKNWPARILGVYIEYQQADGTPIPWSVLKNSKEADNLVEPDSFVSSAFAAAFAKKNDDTTKIFWGVLDEGNNVFGIPFPTNETDIEFQWPHDAVTGDALASRAEIYIGGFGAAKGFSDWDSDVDVSGLVATGIMTYGLTAALMAFDVAVVGPLKSKIKGSAAKYAILALAVEMGIVALVLTGEFWKSATTKTVFSRLAGFVGGILFGEAVTMVAEQIYKDTIKGIIEAATETITAEEALEEIPYAGWVLKVLDLAGDISALAATTIECIASPATYKLQIEESMDLTVTVSPDPAHGTDQQAPIWPMVSDHFVTVITYPKGGNFEGGTTYVKSGPMPGAKDAPISVVFEKVPAGGMIEIVTTIYSDSDWIAGKWNSGVKPATPDEDGQLEYSGAITENLVPLTPSTTYSEKQRVGFDTGAQKHVWVVTSFSIESKYQSDLDAGNLSADFHTAFQSNGVTLPDNSQLVVTKISAGANWKLTDKTSNTDYTLYYRQVYGSDGVNQYEITVQNSTRPSPALPNPKTVPDTSGSNHNLAELVNMTIDNKAYQLGYTWKASGMNMPLDNASSPVGNNQMYTMQSISTLAQPSDLIVESAIGYSQMPFIAYNQFGLTPLFYLDAATYSTELNAADGKALPQDLNAFFTKMGSSISAGSTVKVIKSSAEWRILDATGAVTLDLLVDRKVENGVVTSVINVFDYAVPGITNFYMDPRPGPNGYYHLRSVSFNDGTPGAYKFDNTFDPAQANSWGAFPIPNGSSIYQLAIHPSGYAVANDYGLDKLWALQLPAEPSTMATAPIAMPLSGSGNLEGLMSQPKAMTIAADGRIIILEQGNDRFQSLDIKGNPVATFNGAFSSTLPSAISGDLDSNNVSVDLLKAFQTAVPGDLLRAPLFTEYDDTPVSDLDNGLIDDTLMQYFKDHIADLPPAATDITVQVNMPGSSWIVTDTTSNVSYDIRWNDDDYELFVYYAPNLQIDVVATGIEWKISDKTNSLTFEVKAGTQATDPLSLQQLVSTASMRPQPGKQIQYMDIGTENKGYIYVLYFENAGTAASQYMLDIYNPDGSVLLATPLSGIAAAKMSVDQWRTLWTLNYEIFLGPGNRTEPTVSGWIPSTPEGPTVASNAKSSAAVATSAPKKTKTASVA